MGLWDSIVGIAGDALGQWVTGKNQEDRASTAWKREKTASATAFNRSYDAYKMRYQDTMADMKQAGLNPIMAASGGFNVGNSVTYPKANAPMASSPNYQFTSSAKNWAETTKSEAQTEKIQEEIKEVREKTKKAIADTYLSRAKKGLITVQERETVKKILLLEKQVWTEIAKFQKTMKESYKAVAQRKLIRKQTGMLKAQIERLKKIANVYKGPLGQLIAYLNALTGTVNIGGSASMSKMVK